MEAWINERKPNMDGILPTNGEEMSISRVGKDLYEKVRLELVNIFTFIILKMCVMIIINHHKPKGVIHEWRNGLRRPRGSMISWPYNKQRKLHNVITSDMWHGPFSLLVCGFYCTNEKSDGRGGDRSTNIKCCVTSFFDEPLWCLIFIQFGFVFFIQIFKDYTKKQWDKYPSELDASVLARLPFRCQFQ